MTKILKIVSAISTFLGSISLVHADIRPGVIISGSNNVVLIAGIIVGALVVISAITIVFLKKGQDAAIK